MDGFKIYTGHIEVSRAVQRVLLAAGFRWSWSGGAIQDHDRWLFLYPGGKTITTGDNFESGVDRELPELSMADIFHDTSKWRPEPVKEMTVAEISKELGYTVKVVE
jgi:hypothetical protein